jgi:phenylacetate-CoA ligase
MIEKFFRAHSRRLQAAYDRMPPSVQNVLTTARGWSLAKNRYAPGMFAFLAELRSHETWSSAQVAEYQLQALQRALSHAQKTVPFYAHLSGIRVRHLEDLAQFPVLKREQVRQAADRLVSKAVSAGQRVRVGTTGTTGASLRIAYSTNVARRNWAFRMRQLAWAGIEPRSPRITLFGSRVAPAQRSEPPYWTYNHAERQLLMSIFHLSENTASDYIQCLRRHEGEMLEAFPSVLGILADLLLQRGETVPMRAVFTDGEPLYPFLRAKIGQAFAARVYDTYGNTELCGLIQECEHGQMHLIPEFGYLEILDDNDQSVAAGQEGYFVWTALINDVMPLIRYRIGDRGCWQSDARCDCGRAFPRVVPTITRDSDLLRCPDGRILSPRTVNQLLKYSSAFRFCQFVQSSPRDVTVRAVASNGNSNRELVQVQQSLQELLGAQMNVQTELAPEPIVRAGGKIPLIVQRIAC